MIEKAVLGPLERPNSYVGRALSRPGARRAVAGRGKYTDDILLPRTVHAAFVRSPYPHARIGAIETAAAERQPGVVLVMTGARLAELCTGPWIGTLILFRRYEVGASVSDGSGPRMLARRARGHDRGSHAGPSRRCRRGNRDRMGAAGRCYRQEDRFGARHPGYPPRAWRQPCVRKNHRYRRC